MSAAPPTSHRLAATPDTCFWGYFERPLAPVIEIDSGEEVLIEAVSHHCGDRWPSISA